MTKIVESYKLFDTENDRSFEHALGLQWHVESDLCLMFASDKSHTRRGILSVASSLYDPLGLVAPVTLIPKLVFQNACRQNLQWDEKISKTDAIKWSDWLHNLYELAKLELIDVLNRVS